MLIKLVKNKLIFKEVRNHTNHSYEFNNFVRYLLLKNIHFEFYCKEFISSSKFFIFSFFF